MKRKENAVAHSRFDGDMYTCELLLRLVTIVHPKFEFAWVLPDMRATLVQELDFEAEVCPKRDTNGMPIKPSCVILCNAGQQILVTSSLLSASFAYRSLFGPVAPLPQAQNVERCGSHFSGTSGIAVPKILHSLTSKRILTAEFIDGCVDNGRPYCSHFYFLKEGTGNLRQRARVSEKSTIAVSSLA
jgi:hypothetical protein